MRGNQKKQMLTDMLKELRIEKLKNRIAAIGLVVGVAFIIWTFLL